jgi:uncharacterized membrane protein YGL010W
MVKKEETKFVCKPRNVCIHYFGVFLVVLGIIWLLDDIGIISLRISLWPIVFIVLGIGLILNRFNKHFCD